MNNESIIEVLFNAYSEGNTAMQTPLAEQKDRMFNSLAEQLRTAGIDEEYLSDLQYITMKAAFSAGINTVKAMLS